MTMTMTKTKINLLAVFVLAMISMFMLLNADTVSAQNPPAAGNGTDVDVTMDTNGNVKIEGGGFNKQSDGTAWTNFFKKYRTIISGVSGIAAITFIAFFIFYFMKLGATAGNPQARSQTLLGLLWTGIAAAGLGSVSIVVGFFYNALA